MFIVILLPVLEFVFTACDDWTVTPGEFNRLDLRQCPARTVYWCDRSIVVEGVLVGIDCCEEQVLFRNGFDETVRFFCDP